MQIKRTEDEIDEVMNWAAFGFDVGSRFPGMSYEEGILNALDWVLGLSESRPDEE